MPNPIPKWWNQAQFPSIGGKVVRTLVPTGLTYGANLGAGATNDESNSAALTAMGTQFLTGGASAFNRGRALRLPQKSLRNAQDDLQLELSRAGIKSPKDVLPEQAPYDKSLADLDANGIPYSSEYAAALAAPVPNRTQRQHNLVWDAGKTLGRDPTRDAPAVAAHAANEAALKAKTDPIERAEARVDTRQKKVDAIKANQAPGRERTASRNALIAGGAGLAATPALNALQTAGDALSSNPGDPNAPSWGGALYRNVRDAALTGVSKVIGPPKPDEPGLPWDKIAIGGGAAALLAALLYKTMGEGKDDDEDPDEEEG